MAEKIMQAFLKKGQVFADLVPAPALEKGKVLIRVAYSCISSGTEISNIKASEKSIFQRALERPENITKVIELLKKDGLKKTAGVVVDKTQSASVVGNSVSGFVELVGEGVENLLVGDLVAASGAGYANHAEMVCVPANLVVKVPTPLSLDLASTVTLGGIAMQGVRRAAPALGDYYVVQGVGALGLLTVQLLKLSGARVAAVDLQADRLEIAKSLGADICVIPQEAEKKIDLWTGGKLADGVIFTASTNAPEALSLAFKLTRKKGHVILVGVAGNQFERNEMYLKELDFKISMSSGPGRYDRSYEENGLDYPYAYVRWTENRNMAEYLRLLSINAINVSKLIAQTFKIDEVTTAFETLAKVKLPLILLSYEDQKVVIKSENRISSAQKPSLNFKNDKVINIGLIGAGAFAKGTLIPMLKTLDKQFKIKSVVTSKGSTAKASAEKFKIPIFTTVVDEVLYDSEIDLIVICTPHESHAPLLLKCLNARKNVFVEKPLAITFEEIQQIQEVYNSIEITERPIVTVGFNRRFSDLIRAVKVEVEKRHNPLVLFYRVNAGFIPKESSLHESGGRIIGECCHIIDLATFVVGYPVKEFFIESLSFSESKFTCSDNKAITLKFEDGSVATIHYLSVGSVHLGKEFMEVHFDGKSVVMDDFKKLDWYGIDKKSVLEKYPDKGWGNEFQELYDALKSGKEPIPFDTLIQTSLISVAAGNPNR